MDLPALVLTAGRGTRLDPLTRLLAKPAVPLGDRTLIEHVLDWVRAQGVTDLVLNLHHLPATITALIGDGAHLGVRVRYSWEQPLLGSAGGPRRALPLLASDRFLIVNGDTLCSFDASPMLRAHQDAGADVTMAVVPNPDPDHYNGVIVDGDGVVTGFAPRGQAAGTWHFIGIQIVEARAFSGLPDGEPSETVAGFYRDVVHRSPGRIRAWPASTAFLDVGTCGDYWRAAVARETSIRPMQTVVWPGAWVSSAAHLDGCIVAGGVRVPAGFRAEAAVLAPESVARASDHVRVQDGIAVFPIARNGRDQAS
jgi:NDP-sugar pyrophosphorylase family protein